MYPIICIAIAKLPPHLCSCVNVKCDRLRLYIVNLDNDKMSKYAMMIDSSVMNTTRLRTVSIQ